jgi:hypothetical protein
MMPIDARGGDRAAVCLEVARVMAPPHGAILRSALVGLDRARFAALTASRPTPATEPGRRR